MRKIIASCHDVELTPAEGVGHGIAAELTSAGDEPVPVSGVWLCRKGVNVLPEFARGFGFDTADILEGLPPERYQVRVQMLASKNGQLFYGDGKSEFHFPPGRSIRFVMPIPFQGLQFFVNSPAEDVFLAASSLSGEEQTIDVPDLLTVMQATLKTYGHLGRPMNVFLNVIVPSSRPPGDEMEKFIGTVNERPIDPMPNN